MSQYRNRANLRSKDCVGGRNQMGIGNIVLMGIVVLLILLFFISFMLFIRRTLINSGTKANQSANMEEKLDRIIELLENEKVSK